MIQTTDNSSHKSSGQDVTLGVLEVEIRTRRETQLVAPCRNKCWRLISNPFKDSVCPSGH